ncbi:hypothetical protein B9G69_004740 [Bdellovibrio sp. SKB1291214]|uniref:hypothetical protein n=1 Tax=Bdellovibrio sp. SKB1291214 TaxID=1732569 RepID=UPI000B51DB92|nr:hypothetical protein [Bdellovibrio sp. SKB1291214]UYL09880.1 hypothetical protein B9G69_004740 [Bdellovibrio sp. SKB1291214]
MKKIMLLTLLLIPVSSIAGVGGGGVGPRPTNMMSLDFVKTIAMDNEQVTFMYKPFDQNQVSKKSVAISEVNDAYLNALAVSEISKTWTPVQGD